MGKFIIEKLLNNKYPGSGLNAMIMVEIFQYYSWIQKFKVEFSQKVVLIDVALADYKNYKLLWLIFSLSIFVCLFDFILYLPSTIFQLNRDGSSWVDPVLS